MAAADCQQPNKLMRKRCAAVTGDTLEATLLGADNSISTFATSPLPLPLPWPLPEPLLLPFGFFSPLALSLPHVLVEPGEKAGQLFVGFLRNVSHALAVAKAPVVRKGPR